MKTRRYQWLDTEFEVREEAEGLWSMRPVAAIDRAHFKHADIAVGNEGGMVVKLVGEHREGVEHEKDVEGALRKAAISLCMQQAKTAHENAEDMKTWMGEEE